MTTPDFSVSASSVFAYLIAGPTATPTQTPTPTNTPPVAPTATPNPYAGQPRLGHGRHAGHGERRRLPAQHHALRPHRDHGRQRGQRQQLRPLRLGANQRGRRLHHALRHAGNVAQRVADRHAAPGCRHRLMTSLSRPAPPSAISRSRPQQGCRPDHHGDFTPAPGAADGHEYGTRSRQRLQYGGADCDADIDQHQYTGALPPQRQRRRPSRPPQRRHRSRRRKHRRHCPDPPTATPTDTPEPTATVRGGSASTDRAPGEETPVGDN